LPPSISEAVEIALADGIDDENKQRRHKKPRNSLNMETDRKFPSSRLRSSRNHNNTNSAISSEMDIAREASRKFKIPRVSSRRTLAKNKPSSTNAENVCSSASPRPNLTGYFTPQGAPGENSRSSALEIEQESSPRSNDGNNARFRSTATVIDGPGVSATPPIVESDLEPVQSFTQDPSNFIEPVRPRPLDTLAAQDASLPSPSLSPITAAATLANHGALSSSTTTLGEDDSNDVSSLDLSQDGLEESSIAKRVSHSRSGSFTRTFGMQPSNPSFMDIPTILDSFDALPDAMKTYVMYQLLRRCSKQTLHVVADVVNPALKCDFIGLLPLELSLNIVRYLDFKSMCRAAQVSRKWREIINSDERAWKELLEEDGYVLPEGELERAIKQGWGWQSPHAADSFERDLSENTTAKTIKSDSERSSSSPPATASVGMSEGNSTNSTISSLRPKRKAASKPSGSNKKQKKKATPTKNQSPSWIANLDKAQGPHAYASAAQCAVPYANVGLPSLRGMHLFKSLYARHHLIQKSWMSKETRPHHITFRAHTRHVVTCLQFDTDKILTGSDDTNINVYDTKTGALRKRLEGHEGGVWALQYEGNTLVSGSTDRSVRVWDIEAGKCTQVFQGHTSTVRCLVILKPTKIGEQADGTPITMPKEPLIITGSRDSSLRVWKLPQPTDRSIFQAGPPVNDFDNPYFIRALTGHQHSVRAIAAHGDTLVSGSYDSTVRVWKISTGDVLHRLTGHSAKVYSVVLDHERNRCISGSMDNLVKVWSLETGECLFNLEGHISLVGLLDLCDNRLVSAAADSTLRIWDPENGQCKAKLTAHTGAITCFQHDGQKVISGSDKTLKMWDIQTGDCVKDLLTDLSGVWQVKFNDRRCVAAVQRNNMTYIEVSEALIIA
jgi:F-box and WD-40 domain protein CDC4